MSKTTIIKPVAPTVVTLADFPIVAVDPGGTVGVVKVAALEAGPGELELSVLAAQFAYPDECRELAGFLGYCPHYIIEQWRVFASSASKLIGQTLPGPEALGFVRGWVVSMHGGHTPLHFIEPNEKLSPETVTEFWGGFYPDEGEHARDALNLLTAWLLKRKHAAGKQVKK